MIEILLSQLTDPFRIGLVVALVLTMLRTEAVTGRVVPLVAGLVFIAVVIPFTMSSSSGQALPWQVVSIGLIANAILLAIVLAVRAVFLRMRR